MDKITLTNKTNEVLKLNMIIIIRKMLTNGKGSQIENKISHHKNQLIQRHQGSSSFFI